VRFAASLRLFRHAGGAAGIVSDAYALVSRLHQSQQPQQRAQLESIDMRDRIFITEADYEQLTRLVAGRRANGIDAPYLAELEQELERAEVLSNGQQIPPDVVTMNSTVRLRDLDSHEVREYALVFPRQRRDINAVSVLAPIGTAILGYRVGSVIELHVPKGVRRLEVLEVLFQPEAAEHGSSEANAA
jgi:regulator of nucleoside diphosphate kinase